MSESPHPIIQARRAQMFPKHVGSRGNRIRPTRVPGRSAQGSESRDTSRSRPHSYRWVRKSDGINGQPGMGWATSPGRWSGSRAWRSRAVQRKKQIRSLRVTPGVSYPSRNWSTLKANGVVKVQGAAAARIDDLWEAIRLALGAFKPSECQNYFPAAGYDATMVR
jgi:hypothetical protein